MGIDPKPFDAKTFVEEDTFVTDEPGAKKRIRLENNIVRHRFVKSRDGKTYVSEHFFKAFLLKISIKAAMKLCILPIASTSDLSIL